MKTVVAEAEARYERAKELYLLGELDRDEFKKELDRYQHIQSTLSYSNPNAIITLVNSIPACAGGLGPHITNPKKKAAQDGSPSSFSPKAT